MILSELVMSGSFYLKYRVSLLDSISGTDAEISVHDRGELRHHARAAQKRRWNLLAYCCLQTRSMKEQKTSLKEVKIDLVLVTYRLIV